MSWSAAAAVFVVSRLSFAYFIGLSGYVLATRIWRLIAYPYLETPMSFFVTAVWFSIVAYVLLSSLRLPYLNPKLRWWTRPLRITMYRDAAILYQGTKVPVAVLNLSKGGAFVRMDEQAAGSRPVPQRLGETCEVTITLIPSQTDAEPEPFASSAQLVWKGAPDTPYRNGMGIKFISLGRAKRRQLKCFLRDEARRNNAAVA